MAGSFSLSSSKAQTKRTCSCTISTLAFICLFPFLLTIPIAFTKSSVDLTFSAYGDLFFSRLPNLSSSSSVLTFPSQSPAYTLQSHDNKNLDNTSTLSSVPTFPSQSPAYTPQSHDNENPDNTSAISSVLTFPSQSPAYTLQSHDIKNPDNTSGLSSGFRIEISNSSLESLDPRGSRKESVSEITLVEKEACDLYVGTWVKDAANYPLYKEGSCPYVDEAFDCQVNGRSDSDYLKWRWKPEGCDLPRFNATDFLVRLRGKRLMLVGDSMNRNQFESLLCLLRKGLLNKSRMYEVHGYKITKGRGYYVFKFEDYNCTVEFVRSHFLVREGTRINGQGNSNPTLSIDRIDKSAGRWKKADIIVFNTGHWWTHGKTARGKNYYKEGDYIYPQFAAVEAYRRALKTWAKWVDTNLDPAKKLVFYRGYSSAHFRGGDWDSGGSCNGETEPILNGVAFLDEYPTKMKIVEEVMQEMQFQIILLNITRLTNFRKDGHPSVYGKRNANGSGARKVRVKRQDCSHWCLPGVPDAWNELIYATLVLKQTSAHS